MKTGSTKQAKRPVNRNKHSKKQAQSQDNSLTAVWNELDEDLLALGPRLFDDKYYDEHIVLSLKGLTNNGKNTGQKTKNKQT